MAFVCVSCDDDDDTDSGTTRIQYNLDLATIDSFLSGEGITPEIDFVSGIRYTIDEEGTGIQPYFIDSVRLNIVGSVLVSGEEFINVENGFFNTSDLPPGAFVSVSKVQEGGKVTAYIPSFYGFGETGNDIVPPNSVIKTEIELLELYNDLLFSEINTLELFSITNELDLLVHPSGIRYTIEQGNGNKPTLGDAVTINYRGNLLGATEFFDSGTGVTFNVLDLIQGWQVMLPELQEGGSMQIYLPSQFGYGQQGFGEDIPPNSILVFDITLLQIL